MWKAIPKDKDNVTKAVAENDKIVMNNSSCINNRLLQAM